MVLGSTKEEGTRSEATRKIILWKQRTKIFFKNLVKEPETKIKGLMIISTRGKVLRFVINIKKRTLKGQI